MASPSSYQSPPSASSSSAAPQQHDFYAGLPTSGGGHALSDAESFASSSEPSPIRSHLVDADGGGGGEGGGGPPQFQNAMELVQRLQAQLKTVRLDKGRLEERCYFLEREVNDISRNLQYHHQPPAPSTAPPTTTPTTTAARERDQHKYHHHHHHHEQQQQQQQHQQHLEQALADGRARLAKAEAQLKSRDKEVHSLQERPPKSHAALQEAESKFLADLSRLFKESAHPEEDVGERAKWERELVLALQEVRRLKEEMVGLRAAAGEREDEGKGGGKRNEGMTAGTTTTRPLTGETTRPGRSSSRKSSEEEKERARLQGKVVRQAERIHADKKVIKLLKKALRRAQAEEGEWEERLRASQEAQKELRNELTSLAQRHEDLVNQLREQVEAMTAAQGLGEEGEGGVRGEGVEEGWVLVDVERRRHKKEKKHKEKKGGRKHGDEEEAVHHHHHHHRRHHHHHRKEEQQQQQQQDETVWHHHDRHHHHPHHHHHLHHQQEDHHHHHHQQQQQQAPPEVRRRNNKTRREKTPPRAQPQAWEINFPAGRNAYEVSPLIHRFGTHDGK